MHESSIEFLFSHSSWELYQEFTKLSSKTWHTREFPIFKNFSFNEVATQKDLMTFLQKLLYPYFFSTSPNENNTHPTKFILINALLQYALTLAAANWKIGNYQSNILYDQQMSYIRALQSLPESDDETYRALILLYNRLCPIKAPDYPVIEKFNIQEACLDYFTKIKNKTEQDYQILKKWVENICNFGFKAVKSVESKHKLPSQNFINTIESIGKLLIEEKKKALSERSLNLLYDCFTLIAFKKGVFYWELDEAEKSLESFSNYEFYKNKTDDPARKIKNQMHYLVLLASIYNKRVPSYKETLMLFTRFLVLSTFQERNTNFYQNDVINSYSPLYDYVNHLPQTAGDSILLLNAACPLLVAKTEQTQGPQARQAMINALTQTNDFFHTLLTDESNDETYRHTLLLMLALIKLIQLDHTQPYFSNQLLSQLLQEPQPPQAYTELCQKVDTHAYLNSNGQFKLEEFGDLFDKPVFWRLSETEKEKDPDAMLSFTQ